MTESEMTTDEILANIRQMLCVEVSEDKKEVKIPTLSELNDIFILTPEMRCNDHDSLREKMHRVLDKMNQKSETKPLDSSWKME